MLTPEDSEKCPSQFIQVQSYVCEYLWVWTDKTKCLVYYDIKQRKAENLHICESGKSIKTNTIKSTPVR